MKKFNLRIILLYILSIFLSYNIVSFSVKSNINQEIFNKSHISSVALDNFFTNIFNIMQDKGKKISHKGSEIEISEIKNIFSIAIDYFGKEQNK